MKPAGVPLPHTRYLVPGTSFWGSIVVWVLRSSTRRHPYDQPEQVTIHSPDHEQHNFDRLSRRIWRTMEQVLLSDPENVKGLFRAGQLHLRLRNIEAAKVSSRKIPGTRYILSCRYE